MGADEWRSFCVVHLPISLINIWGAMPKDSREYELLSNFMDLVSAVRFGSRRSLSESDRDGYLFYMHRYLKRLLELFPGTTITPNQHSCLHWPFLSVSFGPSHATRTFAFEHNNYVMEQIQTNHKIGMFLKSGGELIANSSVR